MSEELSRPDPDALLRQIKAEEASEQRGKLKIFFGSSAGVGKTYAMLASAKELLADGVDVVVGLAETHGRPDTEALVKGLPSIPTRQINHKGVIVREFDLDAALERKPAVLLLDELAHTNVEGSRHTKRWQDVQELLEAGIDVHTTLNVQHLESVNDMVAGITGVKVRETVPDAIFDNAFEIALIDLPADVLLKRLKEGKVYVAAQAKKQAALNFFKKGNLLALRELALRRTAERVDAQMSVLQATQLGIGPAEKILVCIGPDPLSAKLVRAAKRMATGLKAPWTAIYVENQRHYRMTRRKQGAVENTLRLAERMGGETAILHGESAAKAIIAYARKHRFSKIVAGKPSKPRWKDFIFGSLVDDLIRLSGDIDVYVITGEASADGEEDKPQRKPMLLRYVTALLAVGLCTVLASAMYPAIKPVNIFMIYLVCVLAIASRLGRGPTVTGAIMAVLCFKLILTDAGPAFQLTDAEYLISMLALVLCGYFISHQSRVLKLQAAFAQKREREQAALYAMTRELTSTRGHKNIANAVAKHVADVFDGKAAVFMPDQYGILRLNAGEASDFDVKEESVAKWAFDHREASGLGTSTLSSARGIYIPVRSSEAEIMAVLGFIPNQPDQGIDQEHLSQLQVFAGILASSLARASQADLVEQSRIEVEREKLRGILLSSVSHDLRQPVALLTTLAGNLLQHTGQIKDGGVRDTVRQIHEQTSHMARLVTNLLDVTSLEAGAVNLNRQPYFIEELIGSALMRTEELLGNRPIHTDVPDGLPLVYMDGLLIEQVLVNVLENIARHTPGDTNITITVRVDPDTLKVTVADDGPGLDAEQRAALFQPVSGSRKDSASRPLGLALAKGIITAHGGWIRCEEAEPHGLRVVFAIPNEGRDHVTSQSQ